MALFNYIDMLFFTNEKKLKNNKKGYIIVRVYILECGLYTVNICK